MTEELDQTTHEELTPEGKWVTVEETPPPTDVPMSESEEAEFPPPEEDGQGKLFDDPDAPPHGEVQCADCSDVCEDVDCPYHPCHGCDMQCGDGTDEGTAEYPADMVNMTPQPDVEAMRIDHMIMRMMAKTEAEQLGLSLARAVAEDAMSDEELCEIAGITMKEWQHLKNGKRSATVNALMRVIIVTGGTYGYMNMRDLE